MTSHNRERLRRFINQTFDDEALTAFCFDYFPQVYAEFTTGMLKSHKVRLLIEKAERGSRLVDLHVALKRERSQGYDQTFSEDEIQPWQGAQPQTGRNPQQIFISYATEDADFAYRLAADLRTHHWQTWMAPDSIRPGEKWVEAINRGLAECGLFLLVLTDNAVNSRWVQNETNAAIALENHGQIRLLPIIAETPVNPPALWRSYQWISFQQDFDGGMSTLLRELASAEQAEGTSIDSASQTVDKTREIDLAAPTQDDPTSTSGAVSQLVEKWRQLPPFIRYGGIGILATLLLFILWSGIVGNLDDTPTPAGTTVVAGEVISPLPSPVSDDLVTNLAPTPTSTLEPVAVATPPTDGVRLGDTWTRPIDGMIMVYVPSPESPFLLASGLAGPASGFWIDKYEVSNVQYQLCVEDGQCRPSDYADDERYNVANHPVVGISAEDAADYSAWVGGTLPTESQWEYAAIGQNEFLYPWGDMVDGSRLNFCDVNCETNWQEEDVDDGYAESAPVDSYPDGSSWVGALNMAGNASEWTATPFEGKEGWRIIKGGAWNSSRAATSVTSQQSAYADGYGHIFGFRVIISPWQTDGDMDIPTLLPPSPTSTLTPTVTSPTPTQTVEGTPSGSPTPTDPLPSILFSERTAIVTDNNGDSFQVLADYLRFNWEPGLSLQNSGSVPFAEMKEITTNSITATITLLNGNTLVDQISDERLYIQGPTPLDFIQLPWQDVANISFDLLRDPVNVPAAWVTAENSSPAALPLNSLQFSYSSQVPYLGYRVSFQHDYIWLKNGEGILFRDVEELISNGDDTFTITLFDGSQLDSVHLRGIEFIGFTQAGRIQIGVQDLAQIVVPSHAYQKTDSPRTVSIEMQDGDIHEFSSEFLLANQHKGLHLTNSQMIPFNEMESFQLASVGYGNPITVTISLLTGQTIAGQTSFLSGNHVSALRVPTENGEFTAELRNIAQVTFGSPSQTAQPPMARITPKTGSPVLVPSKLLRISYFDLITTGVGRYVWNYDPEIRIYEGDTIPFSSLERLVFDDEAVATIYFSNGRSPQNGTLKGHSLQGVTTSGSFAIDLDDIQQIEFNISP